MLNRAVVLVVWAVYNSASRNLYSLMRKQYIFIFSALALTALLIIVALRLSAPEDSWVCVEGQWIKHGNPSLPAPVAPCLKSKYFEGEVVSWETAKQLVVDCRARQVMQTHARQVFVVLKTGERVATTEPQLDDIIAISVSARARCGDLTIATE